MGTAGDKERSLRRRPLETTFQCPSASISSWFSDTASWSPLLAFLLVSLPESDSSSDSFSEFSLKPNKSLSGWGLRSSEQVEQFGPTTTTMVGKEGT